MSFTTIYFREAEDLIKANRMMKNIKATLKDLEQSLATFHYRGFTLKTVLDDAGWREDTSNLNILAGRRYQYKGYWQRIAIEANLYSYEYLWEGLFRLQLGYDQGKIDAGILIVTGNRSEKSPLGNSVDLVKTEVEALYPTISLPVAVVLFDVDAPTIANEEIHQVTTMQSTETVRKPEMEAAI